MIIKQTQTPKLSSSPFYTPFTLGSSPFYRLAYVCLRLLTCALRIAYVCLTHALRIPYVLLTFACVCLRIQMSYVVNEHVHSRRKRCQNARILVRMRAYACVCLRMPCVRH